MSDDFTPGIFTEAGAVTAALRKVPARIQKDIHTAGALLGVIVLAASGTLVATGHDHVGGFAVVPVAGALLTFLSLVARANVTTLPAALDAVEADLPESAKVIDTVKADAPNVEADAAAVASTVTAVDPAAAPVVSEVEAKVAQTTAEAAPVLAAINALSQPATVTPAAATSAVAAPAPVAAPVTGPTA